MYLNQRVSHKSKLEGVSAYGEFLYSLANVIKARKQHKEEEIRDLEGNIKKTTFEVYTEVFVKVGDLIDDRLVLFSEEYTSLGGRTVMYRCLTV